jgi:ATP-dependent exoDNAse (exonuclease V) alpha subunit
MLHHEQCESLRHFDYGYAVTSPSSQGLTAERVLIHADTSVHPDLISSRFGYVAVTPPATRQPYSPTT